MAAAGRKESWEAGGLTFSQAAVGNGGPDAEDVWDDGAILKAFDDALSTHTRKPINGVEARKWKKHAGQGAAGQPSSDRGVSWGRGVANGGSQQAEGRFASLLAKGNAEASGARRGAGIAGPWEPAPGPRESEGQQRGIPPYGRPGPYDYQRAEEYGAHHHPYGPPQPPPSGVGPAFEEGWDRHGLPPPQPPPAPFSGAGPHAAAFQSLDGVYDDDLADLLLAWYYSGYYTGRYRAMQEARKPRYRRNYPNMPPNMGYATPPPPAGYYGENYERQGYQGYPASTPAAGQPSAPRATSASGSIGKRPGP